MSRFEVDAARVQQAGGAVSKTAAAIRAEVSAMQRHLDELRSSWRGGASDQFSSVVAEWNGTQKKVEDSLDSIQRALGNAATAYAEAEQAATRMFTPA